MTTIGIDIGTTTISLVVMDTARRQVLMSRTVPNGSFIPSEHSWERIQDPTLIVQRTKAVLDEVIGNYPDYSAIGLTGQMHGFVYLDEEGRYVSPLYTWQDGSGDLPVFDEKSMVQLVRERYGLQVASGYGLVTHLYHLKKQMVPENAVSICTIMDYLGMRLVGRKKPLIHVSNAASLGFFDVQKKEFMTDILQELGVNPAMLPEVTPRFERLGYFLGIPVYVAVGDNQASFLGSVGLQYRTALVNMGTGGQVSILSDQYVEAPGIEVRPITAGQYLLAGSSLCGGKAYAILERFFEIYAAAAGAPKRSQYSVMARLLQQAPSEKPLDVVTTFEGTRTDPDRTGVISNITGENFTPANLIRGVLSGMAQELFEMYQTICELTGSKAEKVIASGNGLRKNPVLQEIFSEKFQVPVIMAPWEEEAACGAALSTEL